MENGSIADAVIANRGLNFAGGYGYGGYGGHGREFANDGSNAVRIRAGERASMASHASLSKQIDDAADRARDQSASRERHASDVSIRDKIDDQTKFFTAEINILLREQAENARRAAECCCEAKVIALENQAKTDARLAEVLANQACDARVASAVADAAQGAKLDLLLAERGHGHGGNG